MVGLGCGIDVIRVILVWSLLRSVKNLREIWVVWIVMVSLLFFWELFLLLLFIDLKGDDVFR